MSAAAAIRLSDLDNVAVCCRAIGRGERLEVGGRSFVATQDVALGHKLALTALHTGDKVVKYGMPIGSMTAPAAVGDWVHIHNMKSDYMPAHQRDAHGDHA